MSVQRKYILTKEEYEKLKNLKKEDNGQFEEAVSDIAIEAGYHPAGYAFSDPDISEADGQYIATWMSLSSCH